MSAPATVSPKMGTPPRPTRAMLEASIEAAIALLDEMDGDPDLEARSDDDNDTSDWEASLCGITFGATQVSIDG